MTHDPDDERAPFSRRTGWNLQRNPLSAAVERHRAASALLDLTATNPTACGFAVPGDAIEAVRQAVDHHYQPLALGRAEARAAVAAYYRDHGRQVSARQIVLTASTSEAYAWLFKLLADDGDRALVPRPSYPLLDFLAGLEGVRLDPYALSFDGDRWRLDLESVARNITDSTRAILCVSPHNPTGAIVGPETTAALDDLAATTSAAVIYDEVFLDFASAPPTPSAARPNGLTFTLSGLSKVCGLPQLKLAWIAIDGPPERVDEAIARLEVVADTYLSVSSPAQGALPRLLAGRHGFQTECRDRLARNRAALAGAVVDLADLELLASDGGWAACLRLPDRTDEELVALQLLEATGVAVQPGWFFDFPAGRHLVLSLLPPPDLFDRGLELLIQHFSARTL